MRVFSVCKRGLCAALGMWIVVGCGPNANAQQLAGFARTGTLSAAHANARLPKVFGSLAPRRATRALMLYRVRYASTDERGRRVTLSGLLVLPQNGAPRGLLLWHHGTIVNSALAPSRFRVNAKAPETEAVLLAFASGGYGVAMPDYLGYEAHSGVHPYPLSETNSKSALDFILPARQVAQRLSVPLGDALWVSGYSEGGAVAMWTARRLQERGQSAARAALLSGPYDLSGATRESLLSAPKDPAQFVARLYLLAFMGYSWTKNHGAKLTDFFRPAMAFAINRDFSQNLSDEQIIKRLAATAFLMRARNSMGNVLQPRFYRALQTLDSREPLVAQLRRHDAFNWTPTSPVALWALQSDGIVVAQNTRVALQAFRQRGADARVVRASVSSAQLNHVTGLIPALAFARRFFDGGFASVPDAR